MGMIIVLLTGRGVALSLLVGVPVGAYCGLLVYGRYLAQNVLGRPARRWNFRTRRYDRRLPAFDWLIFCVAALPPVGVAFVLVTVYIF